MKKLTLAAAAFLLAAAPLHAQADDECREPESRGSPAEQRARADSVAAAYAAAHGALRDDILAAAVAAGAAKPEGLVIVDVDSVRKPYIHSVDINFPTAALQSIAPRVMEQAARLPGPGLVCSLAYVRLDPLPRATGHGARDSVEERPELTNASVIRTVLQRWSRRNPAAVGLGGVVEGIITRDGFPAHSRVARTSGAREMDAALLEIFGMLRFRPATVGGVPVDVLVRIPIGVEEW